MKLYQILSRRQADDKVDFAPDLTPASPHKQLLKLAALLAHTELGADDIIDCDEAIQYMREFSYRKIFSGTTHEQFLETDRSDPKAIDWLIAVSCVDTEHYKNNKR